VAIITRSRESEGGHVSEFEKVIRRKEEGIEQRMGLRSRKTTHALGPRAKSIVHASGKVGEWGLVLSVFRRGRLGLLYCDQGLFTMYIS
jgi:hypothetical protein